MIFEGNYPFIYENMKINEILLFKRLHPTKTLIPSIAIVALFFLSPVHQ